MEYEKRYLKTIEKIKETFVKKNHDYGSAVKTNYDKFETYGENEGLKYVFGRIAEKYNRLENLIYNTKGETKVNESIKDTLIDMANYAILAAVSYEEHEILKENSSKPSDDVTLNFYKTIPITNNDNTFKEIKSKSIKNKLIKHFTSQQLYVKIFSDYSVEKLLANPNLVNLYPEKEITKDYTFIPVKVSLTYINAMINSLLNDNYVMDVNTTTEILKETISIIENTLLTKPKT